MLFCVTKSQATDTVDTFGKGDSSYEKGVLKVMGEWGVVREDGSFGDNSKNSTTLYIYTNIA